MSLHFRYYCNLLYVLLPLKSAQSFKLAHNRREFIVLGLRKWLQIELMDVGSNVNGCFNLIEAYIRCMLGQSCWLLVPVLYIVLCVKLLRKCQWQLVSSLLSDITVLSSWRLRCKGIGALMGLCNGK